MKRLCACLRVSGLVMSVCDAPKPSSAQAQRSLIAVPAEGHTGDTLYLSGSGYKPNTQLVITLACPDWFYSPHGNVEAISGPVTDAHGRFVRFDKLRAMALNGERSSPCHIYTNYESN